MVNVLVVGGASLERRDIALAFHRQSPIRAGSFVTVDCDREQARLSRALQSWLADENAGPAADPLRATLRGTLFLDSLTSLSLESQRLLLAFIRRFLDEPFELGAWAGRLVAGCGEDPAVATAAGRFSGALYDSLDKVRVEISAAACRGAA